MRRIILGAMGALLSWTLASSAADALPQKPLTIVVGFGAGGASDIIARILADELKTILDRPVVVENKAGGGGIVGLEYLKNSPADGSVISLVGFSTAVVVPLTVENVTFDVVRDLEPIAPGVDYSGGFFVSPSLGVNTWADYVKWIKANPSKAKFSSGGGSVLYVGFLSDREKIEMTPIIYKSGTEAVTAVMGNQVPAGWSTLSEVIKFHQSGDLKLLGIQGDKRVDLVPDVPTFAELGVPGLNLNWFAFYGPKGMSPEAVSAWNGAINKALSIESVKEKFAGLAIIPHPGTPDELNPRVTSALEAWRPIVKAFGAPKQ